MSSATSCRSKAGITSSSGSETPSRRPTSTSTRFGFTRTAYAGPETGVRDRASYVLEQGDIRLVVTSGLRADSEITQFACRHGDGAEDDRAAGAERRRGLPPGRPARRARDRRAALGRGRLRPRRARRDRHLRRRRSTPSSTATSYAGPYLPGYVSTAENGHAVAASGSWRSTTSSATSSSAA